MYICGILHDFVVSMFLERCLSNSLNPDPINAMKATKHQLRQIQQPHCTIDMLYTLMNYGIWYPDSPNRPNTLNEPQVSVNQLCIWKHRHNTSYCNKLRVLGISFPQTSRTCRFRYGRRAARTSVRSQIDCD